MSRRIKLAVLTVVAAALSLVAAPGAGAHLVVTAGFSYVPASVVVSNDAPAYYVNADLLEHDVVALDATRPNGDATWCVGRAEGTCPLFWTDIVPPGGQSVIHGIADTPPGQYTFTCTVHPYMTGTLIVEPQSA